MEMSNNLKRIDSLLWKHFRYEINNYVILDDDNGILYKQKALI